LAHSATSPLDHFDYWAMPIGNLDSTGIPCKCLPHTKWHHLTWEFKRSASTLTYIAVTLDGVKHYVNRTYTARNSGVNELNVAFQEDLKGNQRRVQNLARQRKTHLLVIRGCSCRLRSRVSGPGAFFCPRNKIVPLLFAVW